MDDTLAGSLNQRCVLALSLAAILVLFNEAIVQPSLVGLMTDAPLINVAGRQRMLSQRLAKTALALGLESGASPSHDTPAELASVLNVWSNSQERLASKTNSRVVQNAFQTLEPRFLKLQTAARNLVELASKPSIHRELMRPNVDIILQNEAGYLEGMERIVGLYESEAKTRVNELRLIGVVVTFLILVALFAIWRSILRPAVGLIRQQVAELRRARGELEDRVIERTRELEDAKERHLKLVEQLGHVDRTTMIGEMASSLAHELNQPLGAIANYAEGCLISLKAPEPPLGEIRVAVERVLEATLRAGRIIGQVRRFVTRHGPNREWFEPNRAMTDVDEILTAEANRVGIDVLLAPASRLPKLWGDPTQIQQVLINLVRNAFESLAAAQVTKPHVIMRTRLVEDETVIFEVEDNGAGIKPGDLTRIFDAYYSTRAEGMGMGLAICRSIIEAHHGQLSVTSEMGVRTVFQFTLPVRGGEDAESEPDGLCC